ncbi:MAG: hypothetical protein M2R45_04032 [Verrucomicrobia subdivision 3 bacterium]|nr:hypothetical protein [Limisphaerales bacterium]MCS1416984.1 hypothetical protein [Limisphaerales bacterium]
MGRHNKTGRANVSKRRFIGLREIPVVDVSSAITKAQLCSYTSRTLQELSPFRQVLECESGVVAFNLPA